jgi:hypothetical protein
MKKLVIPALALVTAFAVMSPSDAEAQRWRGGGRGGAVAAGVAAGILGGALVAGAAARPYYAPGPVYVAPGGYYDDEVVVRRRCWVERRPLVDEYGEVVAYRRQRVCG